MGDLFDLQKVIKEHEKLNKNNAHDIKDFFKTHKVRRSEISLPYYQDWRRENEIIHKHQKKETKTKKGGGKHGSQLVNVLLVGNSNNNEEIFIGYIDENEKFNYTINRDPNTLTIANGDNFSMNDNKLYIDRDGGEREAVDLKPIATMEVDDEAMIELLKNAKDGHNSTPLTGGKSRDWVYKVDAFGHELVMKSNSSNDEYLCICKAYIKGIPVTPPLGLYNNNIIVEAFINQGDHKEDYLKATYRQDIFTDLKNKYNKILETFKAADMGGDFKLDNLMINSDGEIVMTDYYVPGCKKWSEWEALAQREGLNYSFEARLKHYVEVKRRDHEVTYIPILREKNGSNKEFIENFGVPNDLLLNP